MQVPGDDELIEYLDDILSGLKYQDGHYDLVKLHDKEYQKKLQIQIDYWDEIKKEIEAVRNVSRTRNAKIKAGIR